MALSNEEAQSSAHGTSYFRGNIGVTSNSEECEEALISGYEIPMSCNHNFRNLGMFKKACLEGYYNGTPYLAFHGVGKEMLDRIDKYCDVHLRSMCMLYDEEFNLLIVNLRPSPLHGSIEGQLTLKIYDNLTPMGQGPRRALKSMVHIRYGNPGRSSKELDVVFCLSVIEVGVSETLKQL
jgi:hypothetical protein